MPRSQKLIAAITMAFIAYFVSIQILPQLPEGGVYHNMVLANLCIGLVVGWRLMGSRAPSRIVTPLTNGLTGVLALALWGLFVQAVVEMVDKAMSNRYNGPLEALLDIFQLMADFGIYLLTPGIILTFIVGAVISGKLTDKAGRRFG